MYDTRFKGSFKAVSTYVYKLCSFRKRTLGSISCIYYNISSTQTDPLSTEYLWSNSRTQTCHTTIAPHWSPSYPNYLSPDQDKGEQRRIVWSRLHNHRANLANRLARTRDRYLEACRALNPRTTQVESSHNPLYRDREVGLAKVEMKLARMTNGLSNGGSQQSRRRRKEARV